MKDKAPYKGLSVAQFMKKRHPDITVLDKEGPVLCGTFCGYAEGPVTDTACIHLCPEYSSCDEAMHIQDLVMIVEGGYAKTWCDVCGDIVDRDEAVITRVSGKQYKTCGLDCADKL
jgi:hypothetical protein